MWAPDPNVGPRKMGNPNKNQKKTIGFVGYKIGYISYIMGFYRLQIPNNPKISYTRTLQGVVFEP